MRQRGNDYQNIDLHLFVIDVVFDNIFYGATSEDAEVPHIAQIECRSVLSLGGFDSEEICAIDVIKPKCRPSIWSLTCDLDVPELDVLHVTDKEAICGQRAEHPGFRVGICLFFRLQIGHVFGPLAQLMKVDIVDLYVFY